MKAVPTPARLLAMLGLIPFVWAALTSVMSLSIPIERFSGVELATSYGVVILSFMTGVFWGFSTRQSAYLPYILSIIPALFVVFATGWDQTIDLMALGFGFTSILALDRWFKNQALAPTWWVTLRLPVTFVVVSSLTVVFFNL